MSILNVPAGEADSLGLTEDGLNRLKGGPCRFLTIEDVADGLVRLGIDAHHPEEAGEQGLLTVRRLDIEDAVHVALMLAPRAGPIVVFDDVQTIPLVVRADDSYPERVRWLNTQRGDGTDA